MPNPRECPVCRARYSQGEEFCTQDGAALLPAARPGGQADAFLAGGQASGITGMSGELPAGPTDSSFAFAPRDPHDPYEGRVIAGRFVLRQRLGRGGMGVVYLAVHRVLERRYAIKFLRREYIHDKRALLRFLREAKAASVVDHPNIVSIYDYGQTGEGEPFLVMEHVDGISLYQAMHGAGQTDADAAGPAEKHGLPLSQALDIAIQVGRALRHAHERGVVHRDIKPENVLLTHRDGLPEWVKVLDFGLAKMIGQGQGIATYGNASFSQEGGLAGTPEFMAPEMLTSAVAVGAPADLYSLGIMLHDIIAGSPPFVGELREVLRSQISVTPPRLSHRCLDLLIPGDLDRLVLRLLDKDPARRPTAAEAVTQLEHIRSQLPPRSLRSLLLAQTMILPPGDPGRLFLQQRTMLFLRERAGDGSGAMVGAENQPDGARGTAQKATVLMSQKATVVLPQVLQEIDNAEAQLERIAEALLLRTRELGERIFPSGWPREALALRGKLDEISEAEGRLGMMQALLKDRIDEDQRTVQQRREELRHQIIDLSERLQLEALLAQSEEQAIRDALLDRERAFAEADRSGDSSMVQALDKVVTQLQELRAEWRRVLGELAAEVLRGRCPPPARPERKAVEVLLTQFDAAAAMLSLLPAPGTRPGDSSADPAGVSGSASSKS
jgi:serine/threonine protein kinase